MYSITVRFSPKKQRQYEILVQFFREQFQIQQLKAIEFFPAEDFFNLIYRNVKEERKEKILISELSKSAKQSFCDFRVKTLYNPSYSKQILDGYFKYNFSKIQKTIHSYYAFLCEEIHVNLECYDKAHITYSIGNTTLLNRDVCIPYGQITELYNENQVILMEKILGLIKSTINNTIQKVATSYNDKNKTLAIEEKREQLKRKIIALLYTNSLFQNWDWNEEVISATVNNDTYAIALPIQIPNRVFTISVLNTNAFGIQTYGISIEKEDDLIQQISLKCIQDLNNTKIKNSDTKNSNTNIENYYDHYNQEVIPVLHGCKKSVFNVSCYIKFPDLNHSYADCDLFTMVTAFGKENITFSPKYLKVMEYVHLKKYQSCKEFFERYQSKHKITLDYQSGEGLLYGKTKVRLHVQGIHDFIEREVDICFFKDSIVEWKKQLNQCLKEMKTELITSYYEKREAFFNEHKNLVDYFIIREIIQFVERNEKYVTETTIVSAIRSCTSRSGSPEPIYTDYCGKFQLYYSAEDVKKIVHYLIDCDILWQKQIRGYYGSYSILKRNCELTKWFQDTRTFSLKNISKKIKENEFLNDDEALCYFRFIQEKEEKQMTDYLNLITLGKVKGFMSLYQTDFVNAFATAPEEVMQFLKMKIEIEENKKIKKLYNELLVVMKK